VGNQVADQRGGRDGLGLAWAPSRLQQSLRVRPRTEPSVVRSELALLAKTFLQLDEISRAGLHAVCSHAGVQRHL
jgi:hypothetical protein